MIGLLRTYLAPYRGRLLTVMGLLLVQAIGNLYLPELNGDIINNGVAKGTENGQGQDANSGLAKGAGNANGAGGGNGAANRSPAADPAASTPAAAPTSSAPTPGQGNGKAVGRSDGKGGSD